VQKQQICNQRKRLDSNVRQRATQTRVTEDGASLLGMRSGLKKTATQDSEMFVKDIPTNAWQMKSAEFESSLLQSNEHLNRQLGVKARGNSGQDLISLHNPTAKISSKKANLRDVTQIIPDCDEDEDKAFGIDHRALDCSEAEKSAVNTIFRASLIHQTQPSSTTNGPRFH